MEGRRRGRGLGGWWFFPVGMPAKLPITQRNLIFTFSITYAIGLQMKITIEQNAEVDSEDEYGIYCSENLQKTGYRI